MSQENFELSSNENKDNNTSKDNDVMKSKEAKVIIVEAKNLDKINSTEQEHAS